MVQLGFGRLDRLRPAAAWIILAIINTTVDVSTVMSQFADIEVSPPK